MAQVDRTRTVPAAVKAPRAGDPFGFLGGASERSEPVSLANVDPDTLRDAVAAWIDQGHAITIGRTSDGGAIGVHLLAGGKRASRYFPDVAGLEDFLTTVRANAQGK